MFCSLDSCPKMRRDEKICSRYRTSLYADFCHECLEKEKKMMKKKDESSKEGRFLSFFVLFAGAKTILEDNLTYLTSAVVGTFTPLKYRSEDVADFMVTRRLRTLTVKVLTIHTSACWSLNLEWETNNCGALFVSITKRQPLLSGEGNIQMEISFSVFIDFPS